MLPAYGESPALMTVEAVHHTALVATTATSVGVTGDVLAPLFDARPGVETAVALTIRPLNPDQT